MPFLRQLQRPLDALRRASEGPNHKWWAFSAVSIGIFMSTLDISIVNISLPRIMVGLNTGFDSVQWVILAYLLTITSLLLAFGRLADLAGRKKVYIAGFAVFTLGNLAAALAPNVLGLTGPALRGPRPPQTAVAGAEASPAEPPDRLSEGRDVR